MKKFVTIILIGLLGFGAASFAQTPQKEGKANRVEKIKRQTTRLESEHIAYLTQELDLSVEEAQAFWPVYSQIKKEQDQNYANYKKLFKALKHAIKENKSEAEISEALDAAIKAKADQRSQFTNHIKDVEKVLGKTKAAKFFVAEEAFRAKQIHRFGEKPNAGHQGENK